MDMSFFMFSYFFSFLSFLFFSIIAVLSKKIRYCLLNIWYLFCTCSPGVAKCSFFSLVKNQSFFIPMMQKICSNCTTHVQMMCEQKKMKMISPTEYCTLFTILHVILKHINNG